MSARLFFHTLKSRLRSMPESRKLLLLSLVVGVCSGFAAVLLVGAIDLIKKGVDIMGGGLRFNWTYLVLPGLGMLLSLLLVRYLIKDDIGHGVTKVLQAVSRSESRIRPHNMWSSLLTSALTIGFGGSVGAEAPIVYTGAAIGSNFARYMRCSYKHMTVLLGCGAAGAIAGIFKAPLAGVLFTMEILLFNISMSSMLPLLFATVSATVVSYAFTGDVSLFHSTVSAFKLANVPFYMLLGVVGGFGSLYFVRTTLWLEDKLGAMSSVWRRWILCALGLGLLIFLFPALYGEGYGELALLLDHGTAASFEGSAILSGVLGSGAGVLVVLVLVFLFKVFAMTLTNAGGGVGGTFGPTLFEGAILGFVVARALNLLPLGLELPEQNFALVGMAAMMAGVMQAPMTAIFLIAEISGGYALLLPLIITAAISFGTMRIFERYSIYAKRIAQRGELLTHDSDQAVLTLLRTSDLVRDKYPKVGMDTTLRQVVSIISKDTAAVFAVVDAQGMFKGLVDIDNARSFIFQSDKYDSLRVRDFVQEPAAYVYEDEPMDSVMRKFDATQAWRLPVVTAGGRYLGFISRSRILSAYREELKLISQD